MITACSNYRNPNVYIPCSGMSCNTLQEDCVMRFEPARYLCLSDHSNMELMKELNLLSYSSRVCCEPGDKSGIKGEIT